MGLDRVSLLAAACAAEIATLQPFASHADAVRVINHGLRRRYLSRLAAEALAQRAGDPLVQRVGALVNLACDRAVALTLPAGTVLSIDATAGSG